MCCIPCWEVSCAEIYVWIVLPVFGNRFLVGKFHMPNICFLGRLACFRNVYVPRTVNVDSAWSLSCWAVFLCVCGFRVAGAGDGKAGCQPLIDLSTHHHKVLLSVVQIAVSCFIGGVTNGLQPLCRLYLRSVCVQTCRHAVFFTDCLCSCCIGPSCSSLSSNTERRPMRVGKLISAITV